MFKFRFFSLLTLGLVLAFISSCSQVNEESRNHYYRFHEKPMRHGVMPLVTEDLPKGEEPVLDELSVARGKVLYQKNCMECHGSEGRGDGPRSQEFASPPRDLARLAKEVPNFKFFIMVSRYEGSMPGWRQVFSQKDLKDLESYLRSLSRF